MEEVLPILVVPALGIRDTVIFTWVAMALLIGLAYLLRQKAPELVEMLIDFLRSQIGDVMRGVEADPYIPFLGAMFLFLAVVNNLGVIPGLRTPTMDINSTVAMAVVVLFAVHVFAIRAKGLRGYLKEMATPLVILDIISDLSRTLALSLRLFGNILAGEILVAVMYRLLPQGGPLPMVALGLVTSLIQAYIFMVLTTSAIGTAVAPKS